MDPEIDDFELMAASATGDEDAFRCLVERHQGLVRGTIFRMGWGNADTEDLAQQVFVRVWKAAATYRPEAKFTTWLMTITRNVIFSEARSRNRVSMVSMDDPEPSYEVLSLAERKVRPPDAAAHAEDVRRAVDAALLELPEKQRLALILHRYDGLSHEEVATVLDTSVASVKSLIFRARESLRLQLAQLLSVE